MKYKIYLNYFEWDFEDLMSCLHFLLSSASYSTDIQEEPKMFYFKREGLQSMFNYNYEYIFLLHGIDDIQK